MQVDIIQRERVLNAFDSVTGVYFHQEPHEYSNFIDGLAWCSLLSGACRKVNDVELAVKAETFITTLISIDKDARNYAPVKVSDDWKQSKLAGIWYKEDPQSFAGPASLQFAIDSGAPLKTPFSVKGTAKTFVAMGWFFGALVRKLSFLQQHIDSVWLAHLMLNKKPASTMLWMCEHNAFFSAIAGKMVDEVEYCADRRFRNGKTSESKEVQPMRYAKPNSWPWRRWPYDKYEGSGELETDAYVPTGYVVATYLQMAMRNQKYGS